MQALLEMKKITKVYDNGVTANKDIDLEINEGEIHALMGENGAGKSTLMKILFGIEKQDAGKIFYRGKEVKIDSPSVALSLGIGMVNQHFMLVDSLKVYENIYLGMMKDSKLITNDKHYIEEVRKYSEKFGFNIDPLAVTEDVSVSMKQKIEILKVLVRGSKLIILDEPTAVLTPQETKELFEQFLLLKKEGYTIIFISHKINEVMSICDRATILKDGKSIDTVKISDVTPDEINKLMIGRNISTVITKNKFNPKKVILSIKGLNYAENNVDILHNINFQIRSGEILGIAGVDGNGQNELAYCVMGLNKIKQGQICMDGVDITNKNVKTIRENNISMIPEDRMTLGIAENMSIKENLISDKINKDIFKDRIGLSKKKIDDYTNNLRKQFNIKSRSIDDPINMLSGGNMQKVVVARELSSEPRLLIANQPSRGVDVGAKHFIWDQILEFRDQSNGILLISADLNEILELSDNIIVMLNGEIVAYFKDVDNITENELGLYMLGVKREVNNEAH